MARKKVSIGQVLKRIQRETGKAFKLVPHYSEKLRKWTVKAIEVK